MRKILMGMVVGVILAAMVMPALAADVAPKSDLRAWAKDGLIVATKTATIAPAVGLKHQNPWQGTITVIYDPASKLAVRTFSLAQGKEMLWGAGSPAQFLYAPTLSLNSTCAHIGSADRGAAVAKTVFSLDDAPAALPSAVASPVASRKTETECAPTKSALAALASADYSAGVTDMSYADKTAVVPLIAAFSKIVAVDYDNVTPDYLPASTIATIHENALSTVSAAFSDFRSTPKTPAKTRNGEYIYKTAALILAPGTSTSPGQYFVEVDCSGPCKATRVIDILPADPGPKTDFLSVSLPHLAPSPATAWTLHAPVETDKWTAQQKAIMKLVAPMPTATALKQEEKEAILLGARLVRVTAIFYSGAEGMKDGGWYCTFGRYNRKNGINPCDSAWAKTSAAQLALTAVGTLGTGLLMGATGRYLDSDLMISVLQKGRVIDKILAAQAPKAAKGVKK